MLSDLFQPFFWIFFIFQRDSTRDMELIYVISRFCLFIDINPVGSNLFSLFSGLNFCCCLYTFQELSLQLVNTFPNQSTFLDLLIIIQQQIIFNPFFCSFVVIYCFSPYWDSYFSSCNYFAFDFLFSLLEDHLGFLSLFLLASSLRYFGSCIEMSSRICYLSGGTWGESTCPF